MSANSSISDGAGTLTSSRLPLDKPPPVIKRKVPEGFVDDCVDVFSGSPLNGKKSPFSATATPTTDAAHDSLPATPCKPATQKSTPKSTPKRKLIPTDPINTTIYELRKQGLKFDAIAEKVNSHLSLTGFEAMTAPACYSRFVRNAPLVATARGEEYKREWYIRAKGEKGGKSSPASASLASTQSASDASLKIISEGEEEEFTGIVATYEKDFWMNVALAVNATLGKEMTEDEVKAAYERIGGRD